MSERVLVTGATGYIGGRLVHPLIARGLTVRVFVRDASRLGGRSWQDKVEIVEGDVLDAKTIPAALENVDIAYYLIHSLESGKYLERDIEGARAFGKAARDAGVKRIIYMSGLGDPADDLSEHLRSRHMTGDALRESGVPVTEFRAAVIVGAGSVSFDMVRYLTDRLPIMITPKWVSTRIQPIGIDNVIQYLTSALDVPDSTGEIIEIGGADVLRYREMMLQYAQVRKLRRILIPVPVLTPRLSSYWVHLITPVNAKVARALIDGLKNEVVVRDDKAKRLFPAIKPIAYREAVERALRELDANEVESTWTDPLVSSMGSRVAKIFVEEKGMLLERRQIEVNAPPAIVYRVCARIGGANGWLVYNRLWQIRGGFDRWIGGVGSRRSRRHPDQLRVGDAFDVWRVEAIKPDGLIRLRAEMKLPGQGWLEFKIEPQENGTTRLTQTAYYAPVGVLGLLYWYVLVPFHGAIFGGMLRELKGRSEKLAEKQEAIQGQVTTTTVPAT